jgi:hypothetical protein
MKEQYDILTNYGENYVPEIHDPKVAELAAKNLVLVLQRLDKFISTWKCQHIKTHLFIRIDNIYCRFFFNYDFSLSSSL